VNLVRKSLEVPFLDQLDVGRRDAEVGSHLITAEPSSLSSEA
jgi:hypothetical protein